MSWPSFLTGCVFGVYLALVLVLIENERSEDE